MRRSWCRLVSVLCLIGLLCSATMSPRTVQAGGPELPDNLYASEVPVSAETAAVIDVDSGRILYGKDMHKKMRIASLTKIITAILAIESGKLDETVTVSQNAAGKEGSSIYLQSGEKLKLIDLVYAIMLRSGNDAATAIAEHVAGSTDKFADLMNQKVKELSLTGTHFTNPHGLDNDQHFSTAYDMAVLTAYALKNPTFRKIVATERHSIPWEGKEWDRAMRNKNKMLTRYEGADGVKTGYTEKAGRCLASSATRDGRQIAVIVLNDRNDWADSSALLNYGFTHYHSELKVEQDKQVAEVPVVSGETGTVAVAPRTRFSYPVRDGEAGIRTEIKLPAKVQAPVKQGQVVGSLLVYQGDTLLRTIDLIALQPVKSTGFWYKLKEFWLSLWRE